MIQRIPSWKELEQKPSCQGAKSSSNGSNTLQNALGETPVNIDVEDVHDNVEVDRRERHQTVSEIEIGQTYG